MGEHVFIGIEIGGTKLQIVAGDGGGRIEQRLRLSADPAGGAERIRQQIDHGLFDLVRQLDREIGGACVGFGGPVDHKFGRVSMSHQVNGWEGYSLQPWLQGRINGPIAVENDANTAALGEALSGAGDGFSKVFYANFGSGVGGGMVVDHLIYHGAMPGEAEFGHLRLDRNGATVESRCSGWAVDARIRRAVREQRDASKMARIVGMTSTGGESRHLAAAMAAGDPCARRILDEVAGDIGFALSHVVHLFHPDVIVLGGGLSLVGEPFRAAVDASLRPHVMHAFAPGPKVALAALGEDAVPVGALYLAAREARIRRQPKGPEL